MARPRRRTSDAAGGRAVTDHELRGTGGEVRVCSMWEPIRVQGDEIRASAPWRDSRSRCAGKREPGSSHCHGWVLVDTINGVFAVCDRTRERKWLCGKYKLPDTNTKFRAWANANPRDEEDG